jgi:hypothetical protein
MGEVKLRGPAELVFQGEWPIRRGHVNLCDLK